AKTGQLCTRILSFTDRSSTVAGLRHFIQVSQRDQLLAVGLAGKAPLPSNLRPVNDASDEPDESKSCPACSCEDFLEVRSDVLPGRPVTLVQCEDCGAQYSTGVLPQLG